MAAAKLPPEADEDELIPFNMRMPKRIVEALDSWVGDLNRGRRVGRVTRSDVVRVLLERGAALRPSLDEDGEPGKALAVLHDQDGRESATKPIFRGAPGLLQFDGDPPKYGELVRAHYAEAQAMPSELYPNRALAMSALDMAGGLMWAHLVTEAPFRSDPPASWWLAQAVAIHNEIQAESQKRDLSNDEMKQVAARVLKVAAKNLTVRRPDLGNR